MSVRSTIEDGVRAWLVAAGVAGGIPSAASAVIFADQDAVRPPLPYLVVRVVVYDIPIHEDEDLFDDEDPPRWRGRGNRTSTVSVNAYGTGAEAWLERATLFLRSPATLAQLGAAGLAVRPEGGLNNLSGLLDESTQVRFQRDFAVDYVREGADPADTEDVTELETVIHEDTWTGGPDDLVVTHTEVL